jgi:hypothetical protein
LRERLLVHGATAACGEGGVAGTTTGGGGRAHAEGTAVWRPLGFGITVPVRER